MSKTIFWRGLFFLAVLLADRPVLAASMVLFDFDQIQSHSKKGANASDVEAYMEGLFGSDITLSQKTSAVNSSLKVGKGKGAPAITIDFGANPIDSFRVDFQLFKKAKSFTILADGVVINQQTLSKAQRKAGLTGHQSSYFFDTPVQTLQLVGLQKKSFAIDNLAINIPYDESESGPNENGSNWSAANVLGAQGLGDDIVNINQVTATVAEPSSLLMLAVGLYGALVSRRIRAR
jgi:hypothetical protein